MVLARDALWVNFAWVSCMRGADAGSLRLGDVRQAPGVALVYPLPDSMPAGATAVVELRETKNCKGRRAPPIHVGPHEEPALSFLPRFASFLKPSEGAGWPITDHVIRPLDGKGFRPGGMGSSALLSRQRLHLRNAGLDGGETTHSFRRGRLQAESALGAMREQLAGMGQIKTPGVLIVYLDGERHQKRCRTGNE